MNLWNALLLALREIRRNVLRSSLTVLGIIIGVAAVITMVTVGAGATAEVTSRIASLGSNLLIVRPGQGFGPGRGGARARPFDAADAEAIAQQVGNLRAVAPTAQSGSLAIFGNRNWQTVVTGTTNGWFEAGNWELADGRLFSATELRAGRSLCILGETPRNQLFGTQNPVGSTIRLNALACRVVGLLQAKGQSAMGTDQDDVVVLPLRTFQRRISGDTDVNVILLSVADGVATEVVKEDVERLLRQRRHVGAGKESDFNVFDTKQIAQTLTGTTRVLTMLLGSVAGVSLLVGGIGIMNIMLVSVTERTREIGIALALALSAGLTALMDIPFVLDPAVMLLAFAFSAAVGIVFGYFPARRAARLDPIEALRHE